MPRTILVLKELYMVTEWRDDSVYQTKYICDVWVGIDQAAPPDFQFVNKSDPDIMTIGTLLT